MFADFIGEYDSFYGLLAAKDALEEAFSRRCCFLQRVICRDNQIVHYR